MMLNSRKGILRHVTHQIDRVLVDYPLDNDELYAVAQHIVSKIDQLGEVFNGK